MGLPRAGELNPRDRPIMRRSMAEILAFDVAHQRFGVPLADVDEVTRAVSVARLPKAPPIIEGVINLRGAVVPVLDIRSRFRLGAKPLELADQFIVARARNRTVAIRVDRVRDVIALDDGDIAKTADVSPHSAFVVGVAKLPDGLILIHDLATFLTAAEDEALGELEELQSS